MTENKGFSDENVNEEFRRKRRRRPITNENDESKRENSVEDSTPKKEHRRRRRREAKSLDRDMNQNGPLGVAVYLEDLQDDIELKVNTDNMYRKEPVTISKGIPGLSNGAGDKIYIEGTRKFHMENEEQYLKNKREKITKISEKINIDRNHYDNDLLQCSIGVIKRFRIFATFLQGLFAGMMLMHIIFTLVTTGSTNETQTVFLNMYRFLQQPYSIFNYVAFCIVSISIMDRLDFGERLFRCSSSKTGLFVAFILTFIAFIINNCLYMFNQEFDNFKINNNNTFLLPLLKSLPTWRVLDAVKSILFGVGWFIVALVPVYDLFIEHLKENLSRELSENY